jgi:hypothetical protein
VEVPVSPHIIASGSDRGSTATRKRRRRHQILGAGSSISLPAHGRDHGIRRHSTKARSPNLKPTLQPPAPRLSTTSSASPSMIASVRPGLTPATLKGTVD